MADEKKDQGKPGVAERVMEHLAERLNPKTVAKEMFDGVTDKVIPQGAAELGQAIFGQGAYVPYGTGQEPIQPSTGEPDHGVHGPQEAQARTEEKADAPKAEAPQQPEAESWRDKLPPIQQGKSKEISM